VEKWWALQTVYFTGRDITHTWAAAESWQKLEAAIRIRAHVRAAPDQLPEGGATITLRLGVLSFRTHAKRVEDAVVALRQEARALLG